MRLNAAAPSVCVFSDDIGLKLEMLHRFSPFYMKGKKFALWVRKTSPVFDEMKHILEL